jgi:replicative DNA helicase
MSFELLNAEVDKGLNSLNRGIPMGFDRLTKHVGIRKSMFYLIGGNTGSGKTSFIDDAFVLNPVDWALSKEGLASGIKVKVWYRSMERSRTYKMAKWVSRKIFLDQGIIIPVGKLLGWNEKMTKDEHDLFLYYKDYVDQLSEIVTIIDGPENAVGIAKELKIYAETNGRIEQLDKWNKIYIPNDPNEITIVVIDHIGLLKTTKDQPTKKDAIDKMSDELRYARDFYGYSPVVVSQFNRSISNPTRIKNGDVEPQLEDFADSSSTQNDADVVMALFDPIRYKVADPSGYDLDKLKDQYGAKYFRSVRLIKNSYGADDLRIGLAFLGELGIFKELPRKKDITDSDYEAITNKSYFLRE